MHRSGTSAVASAIEALGLFTGPRDQQMAPDKGNPRGYGELASVAALNDRLLDLLGGGWDRPPAPPRHWARDPSLDSLHAEADAIIGSLGARRYVVKDPRICLLMPFWRRVVLDRCSAVVTIRSPAEVAWSLALRDATPPAVSYALWAAYYRSAVEGLSGLPVHVCSYEDLVSHPHETLGAVVADLIRWRELDPDADARAGVGSIEAGLRRDTYPRDDPEVAEVPPETETFYDALRELVGSHDAFRTSPLPAPARWEQVLLDERRQAGATLKMSHLHAERLQSELAVSQRRELELEGRLAEANRRIVALQEDVDATRAEVKRLQARIAHAEDWAALAREGQAALDRRLQDLDLAVAVLTDQAGRLAQASTPASSRSAASLKAGEGSATVHETSG